jgi:hypothetical protein
MAKRKTKTLLRKMKARKSPAVKKNTKTDAKPILPPVHSWRVCPYGEHWVRTHPMHVPPSKTHPEGLVITRKEHCARNASGKDQLYSEEIQEIAGQNFANLKNKPCPRPLISGVDGNQYDDLIAGWTQYWNEVLKPDESLDPNLVKALIASESGFDPNALANKKNSNSARGLMQITNESRKLLGGDHGDLKDHLITVTKAELNDPNLNICAGIRWLFEKRRLLSSRLKKSATWLETIWDYKAVKRAKTKKKAEEIKMRFNSLYEELQKCGKA